VARGCGQRGRGLALPFLDEEQVCHPEVSQTSRWNQIASEVEAYLAAVDGDPIPGQEDAADEMPEPLEELRRVEKFGLPRAGGLYDQPYHFMKDLEYADLGRKSRDLVRARNAEIKRNNELRETHS